MPFIASLPRRGHTLFRLEVTRLRSIKSDLRQDERIFPSLLSFCESIGSSVSLVFPNLTCSTFKDTWKIRPGVQVRKSHSYHHLMERIFFKTDIEDAYSGLPVYVFDTLYLPSPDVIDYDLFIPTLMNKLPLERYILVMFSCGLNKISWIHGVKFLRLFLSPEACNFDNLHKIIAVHESWFVKSISLVLTNISISKKTFSKLHRLFDSLSRQLDILISCGSLEELSNYVDVTRLKISLNIYKHDAQTTLLPRLLLNCPTVQIINERTTFDPESDPLFCYHFNQIFRIIETYGTKAEAIFMKPGNRQNTEILFQCIVRNQYIWINDWDLHCIASTFKKILLTVTPLINIEDIVLPMKDDLDYTLMVLSKNFAGSDHAASVLFRIIDLCHKIVVNPETTQHLPVSVAKCMCHALTHELKLQQNSDRVSIAVRYIKNLIQHWSRIRPLFQERLSEKPKNENRSEQKFDELYNLSHDITMDEENTSGEEESQRVQFNTKTILDNDTTLARTETTSRNNIQLNSKKEKLQDVSNIKAQWPPQKYRFERKDVPKKVEVQEEPQTPAKRPVVRGRKVGELTRLFEQRTQAMKLLGAI